jgi:hypothetical protein
MRRWRVVLFLAISGIFLRSELSFADAAVNKAKYDQLMIQSDELKKPGFPNEEQKYIDNRTKTLDALKKTADQKCRAITSVETNGAVDLKQYEGAECAPALGAWENNIGYMKVAIHNAARAPVPGLKTTNSGTIKRLVTADRPRRATIGGDTFRPQVPRAGSTGTGNSNN